MPGMSRTSSSPDHDHPTSHRGAPAAGIAPGKQTLTQSLRGQERDVASFDASGEYRETRATIQGTPTTSPLTDRQLQKARRRNPYWQQRLGFRPASFGGGDVASGELADNVAARQAELGLTVDGIAGPKTVAAVEGGTAKEGGATKEGGAGGDTVVTDIDADGDGAVDDPFGMHLF